jgi:hypothetical protein
MYAKLTAKEGLPSCARVRTFRSETVPFLLTMQDGRAESVSVAEPSIPSPHPNPRLHQMCPIDEGFDAVFGALEVSLCAICQNSNSIDQSRPLLLFYPTILPYSTA